MPFFICKDDSAKFYLPQKEVDEKAGEGPYLTKGGRKYKFNRSTEKKLSLWAKISKKVTLVFCKNESKEEELRKQLDQRKETILYLSRIYQNEFFVDDAGNKFYLKTEDKPYWSASPELRQVSKVVINGVDYSIQAIEPQDIGFIEKTKKLFLSIFSSGAKKTCFKEQYQSGQKRIIEITKCKDE